MNVIKFNVKLSSEPFYIRQVDDLLSLIGTYTNLAHFQNFNTFRRFLKMRSATFKATIVLPFP